MNPILLLNIETYENAPRGLVVLQALIDLIPVGLFLAASIILLHALHNKFVVVAKPAVSKLLCHPAVAVSAFVLSNN